MERWVKRFSIKLNCMAVSAYLKANKLHLINFKELSSQELNDMVDLGIEVKT